MNPSVGTTLLKPGLPASVYFEAVKSILPEEWMVWEPETIWSEIEEETGIDSGNIPAANRNKMMAYRVIHNSSAPWEDWHAFMNVALALNGVVPNPDVAQTLSPSHVAWAIAQMQRVHPDWEFSDSVRSFIAVMLYDDGICWVPGSIGDIANEDLFRLQKRFEGLGDFVGDLARNYVDNMDNSVVRGESASDIHTARLKSMENYVRAHIAAEKVASR